ncbi:hypothetical protein SAMN05892883_2869 [Jatrophihabitans sp. GAS493]|nr:hypothetical protein SAMN05892883_2869 [Jatrophihabitans sp. GAS493]
MHSTHFDTIDEATAHFAEIFDAAAQGRAVTIGTGYGRAAVVDAGRLRRLLATTLPYRAKAVAEQGGPRAAAELSARNIQEAQKRPDR